MVVGVCLQILLVLHHLHSIHHSLPLPQTPKMERMRPGSTIIHHYFHLFHLFMKWSTPMKNLLDLPIWLIYDSFLLPSSMMSKSLFYLYKISSDSCLKVVWTFAPQRQMSLLEDTFWPRTCWFQSNHWSIFLVPFPPLSLGLRHFSDNVS